MKKFKFFIVIFLSFITVGNAFAIGAVSRACQFNKIPTPFRAPAVLFFYALGAPSSVLRLPDADDTTKAKSWILESITTDYVETRYYLYAQADIYFYNNNDRNEWSKLNTYVSPGWGASRISRAMMQDDRFKIYYSNRGQLYSVRAGHPEIVSTMSLYTAYGVVGGHWYYDPSSKRTYSMQDTFAFDCNLTDWGFEKNGMFDW
jgi:hypothetical protein